MIELLKLAAMAAGYEIEWECEINGYYAHGREDDGNVKAWWNPQVSDGDAFQLAADCRLKLDFSWNGVSAAGEIDSNHTVSFNRACGTRRRAAEMRTCILQAAAEIGKDML